MRATTSLSTWAWPADCNYTTSGGLVTTTHHCKIYGLSPDSGTGLIQAATAAKGVKAETSPSVVAATELYLAYDNADYDVVSATYQVNSANSSKRLKALDIYETWQKSALMVEMMKVACWKTQSGAGNAFAAGDSFESSWCHFNNANQDSPTGGQHFHPLIQGIDEPRSLVSIAATATSAKGTFGDGTGSDTSITVAD